MNKKLFFKFLFSKRRKKFRSSDVNRGHAADDGQKNFVELKKSGVEEN